MSERNADRPAAFILQEITLRDDVDHDEFERFVLTELFPSIDTSGDGEEPDQHFLLAGAVVPNEYVWLSRLEYQVHHTPLPQWLFNRVNRLRQESDGQLEAYGTRSSVQVHYDVIGWRRRLGK
jgi:hypothetical protein